MPTVLPSSRTPRILVVDDEPGIRDFVARVLAEEGFEVVLANDGQAGLDAVRGAKVPYNLVITDSIMPHLTGPQLIQQLRREFPGVPVLHLDDGTYPSAGPDLGPVPTLYKPFRMKELCEEVRRLLALSVPKPRPG
jgi:two-component system cell cycle sensor histidine kinase/response regulator CckA